MTFWSFLSARNYSIALVLLAVAALACATAHVAWEDFLTCRRLCGSRSCWGHLTLALALTGVAMGALLILFAWVAR